jgi:outer membrane biosynthesis protein TonB
VQNNIEKPWSFSKTLGVVNPMWKQAEFELFKSVCESGGFNEPIGLFFETIVVLQRESGPFLGGRPVAKKKKKKVTKKKKKVTKKKKKVTKKKKKAKKKKKVTKKKKKAKKKKAKKKKKKVTKKKKKVAKKKKAKKKKKKAKRKK